MALMTIEEKLGQLNQVNGKYVEATRENINEEQVKLLRQGQIGSFLNIIGAAETRRIQHIVVTESRLGIPVLFGLDVIHGFKTIFPIPLAEASTWNPELIEQEACVSAREASAAGIDWTFAPMVDIARDPRWGRIAEGAGEDPYLGSAMAVARVKGFQGKDVRAQGSILACAKHFAAYGAAEGGRDYNSAEISERTLREVYLPPFKAAIDAGVWTFMSAFNDIAGVPCTANQWLLTNVLRNEWAFKGFVVSDWNAIDELRNHRIAATRTDAGLLALNAGVDMDMVAGIYQNEIAEAYRMKQISLEVIDRSVRRVLRTKFAYGLFDNPFRNCDTLREKKDILTPENLALARTVAQQSIVLLKNEKGILPLSKSIGTIALIGPFVDERRHPLGPWSAAGQMENVVTILDGMKSYVPQKTKLLFVKGCATTGDHGFEVNKAVGVAQQSDVVIMVLGEEERMSGEAASRSTLDLPGRQEELLKAIKATGKPIILVLMNGRPLALTREAEDVNAIVESWFLGTQTGNAIADIIFGNVNPSGKLPVSFPRSVGQIPNYSSYKNTGRPFDKSNQFTSRYIDTPNSPLYPFGYGLSYTSFVYSSIGVSSQTIARNQNITVYVDVENIGKRKGDEIVQLYVQDAVASVARPVKQLKGFKKITLEPGEKKKVEFVITPDALAFYNLEMKKVVEPGTFKVFIGGNSVEGIEAKFDVQ